MSSFDASQHPRGQATNRGQFRAKQNESPTGDLTAPTSSTEIDPAELAAGDLMLVGSPYPTRRVADGQVTFRTDQQTVEVIDAQPFGRRTRVTFRRQDGSTDDAYFDAGVPVAVADDIISAREIPEHEARAIHAELDRRVH